MAGLGRPGKSPLSEYGTSGIAFDSIADVCQPEFPVQVASPTKDGLNDNAVGKLQERLAVRIPGSGARGLCWWTTEQGQDSQTYLQCANSSRMYYVLRLINSGTARKERDLVMKDFSKLTHD